MPVSPHTLLCHQAVPIGPMPELHHPARSIATLID